MYILLMVVHIFVCLVLIAVVLLQAGRGGGLSDMLGGGQPTSLFGTQTNAFMVRATEVCAVLFVVTSLTLGIMSTQRGKSLMEKRRIANVINTAVPSALPGAPAAATTTESAVTQAAAQAVQTAATTAEAAPAASAAVNEAAQTAETAAAVPAAQ